MDPSKKRLLVLTSGILSLVLTMGISRFAYTPLLPLMQEQAGLSEAAGGWLATYNYIGYMIGAWIAAMVTDLQVKDRLYRGGLVLAVVTTIGMALTEQVWLWSVLRFLAGFSSAAGLLIGSGLLLNWLYRHQHKSELGIHFSGIGLGIAFAAAAVWAMDLLLDWKQIWWALGLIGVLLMIPAWRWLPMPNDAPGVPGGRALQDNPPSKRFIHLMLAAYFCAGYGYVISATFIVAIIELQPSMQGQGEAVFLVIGLAAAPACILWDFIARRLGVMAALMVAFALQIVGIILPAFSEHLFVVLLSAVMYGFTFVGIVSLVLTMAGRFYPTKPAKLMGKLTLSYGVAQVVAPALAGQLAQTSGHYTLSLYLAAGMMLLGMVFIGILLKQQECHGLSPQQARDVHKK